MSILRADALPSPSVAAFSVSQALSSSSSGDCQIEARPKCLLLFSIKVATLKPLFPLSAKVTFVVFAEYAYASNPWLVII
jgi:hypothetical protein